MSKFDILPTDLTFAQAKKNCLANTGDFFSSRGATIYQIFGPATHEGDFLMFVGEDRIPLYFNTIKGIEGYLCPLDKASVHPTSHYVQDCRYRPTKKKLKIKIS